MTAEWKPTDEMLAVFKEKLWRDTRVTTSAAELADISAIQPLIAREERERIVKLFDGQGYQGNQIAAIINRHS